MIGILFYSTTMFELAGMENPKLGTVIVAIVTTAVNGLVVAIIDRFGRKPLMLCSIG